MAGGLLPLKQQKTQLSSLSPLKRETSPLTSMTVHCSTTMASYVGATELGSPWLLSWKMKTLSTVFGIVSRESEGGQIQP